MGVNQQNIILGFFSGAVLASVLLGCDFVSLGGE
jgi:hypothetical protein